MARFWGKLHRLPDSSAVEELALVDHCIDVSLVFRTLCELPGFRRTLTTCRSEPPRPRIALDRLAVIALLHDIGKCNAGFQAKRDSKAHATAGHVLEVLGLFQSDHQPEAFERLIGEMARWFESGLADVQAMLLASISHHGRPMSSNDLQAQQVNPARWWQPKDGLDPMQGVVELVDAARGTFPGAFGDAPSMIVPPAIQHRFAGMVMLADWIGSDTRFFP